MNTRYFILAVISLTNAAAMEKPNIVQVYKNWTMVRTIQHFKRQGESNLSHTSDYMPSYGISLKDLHVELDRRIRNYYLQRYVILPVISVGGLAIIGVMAYKNMLFYSPEGYISFLPSTFANSVS